jgi:hypothetical protein
MVFSVFSRGAKVRLNLTFMARLYLRSGLVFLSLPSRYGPYCVTETRGGEPTPFSHRIARERYDLHQ